MFYHRKLALLWTGLGFFGMLVLAGCAGETSHRQLPEAGPSSEGISHDAHDTMVPCSATGTAANCNPIEQTGCSQGAACYLVKDVITGCVCPVGTSSEGGSCTKTYECAPGLVCAGTSAPGTCTKICDPLDDQCPAGTSCLEISAFKGYGYCKTK